VGRGKSAVAAFLLTVSGTVACAAQSPVERSADLNPAIQMAHVGASAGPGLVPGAGAGHRSSYSSVETTPAFFFGYVEFDHDPSAPGGVPGFGPSPQATPVMAITAK
jgi:hypothetical protein